MMSRNALKTFAMLVFMVLFFALVYLQRSQVSHVLVIHSYNTDYAWVRSINDGLDRTFADQPGVQVRYHYMDLKNHTDDDFRRTATKLAHRVVDESQPDVLVLFDDAAQRLVGTHYFDGGEDGGPGIKVVFGGVNAEPEVYYGNSENVTGILERKPMAAIRDTGLTILRAQDTDPDAPVTRPRVLFIGDASASITADIPHFTSIDWAPFEWLEPVQVETFDAWKAAVQRAGQEADIILLTNYQQVRESEGGPFVRPASDVMRWTEANSTIPVLGMGWSNSQDGAMLTVSVSPYEQGDIAARKTLEILGGASPGKLGVVVSKQFLVHMCQRALDARDLSVPVFYEAFAHATANFYHDDC